MTFTTKTSQTGVDREAIRAQLPTNGNEGMGEDFKLKSGKAENRCPIMTVWRTEPTASCLLGFCPLLFLQEGSMGNKTLGIARNLIMRFAMMQLLMQL